jgi:hypothetical protein
MHNRLSSRLRAPLGGGVNRTGATPRLAQQPFPVTPNMRQGGGYQQNVNTRNDQHFGQNAQQGIIDKALSGPTDSVEFKILNEIMHSLILHTIQLYKAQNFTQNFQQQQHSAQNSPQTALIPTPNEQKRLAEMSEIFGLSHWMSISQGLLDSLSNKPPLFWSNLQTRLQDSENSIVFGYYSLSFSDVKLLFQLLQGSSYANYLVIQNTIPKCANLQFYHHSDYKTPIYQQQLQHNNQHNGDGNFQSSSQQTQPQPQFQPLSTNVSAPQSQSPLDLTLSPILNRQTRAPITPAFQKTPNVLQNQDEINQYPQQQTPNHQQRPFQRATPGRFQHSTPGRISLRNPIPKSHENGQNGQNGQNRHDSNGSNDNQDPIALLDELPLPTVGNNDGDAGRGGNQNQQTRGKMAFGLQSPIRRTANALFTTPTLQRYGNHGNGNGNNGIGNGGDFNGADEMENRGFGQNHNNNNRFTLRDEQNQNYNTNNHRQSNYNENQNPNITILNTTASGLNHSSQSINKSSAGVQYLQSTSGSAVTISGFQLVDQVTVLDYFSACGKIRSVQHIQPNSRLTTTNTYMLQQRNQPQSTLGRLIVEYDSPTAANNALQKSPTINGFTVSVTPYVPQHLNSYTVVSKTGPYERSMGERAALSNQYDRVLSEQQRGLGGQINGLNNPSQVFKHIYDREKEKEMDQLDSNKFKDILKYSAAIFIIILIFFRIVLR